MSKTIDEKVVEMRFDNRDFQKNVTDTMSILDKLKQKLNLSGASKGLEQVNSAAGKVDMRGLGSAVDTVSARFSALQVVGVTALANITNQAVNTGKRMLSALTIDPIKTGFEEYETQINSVQTILSNTRHNGTTIDEVNDALEQLNLYADKTIYNFTEMTRNIGTFTAAGVDLETSVDSIKGIANLAAVSGSTSQQASTAMYQLSQALAAGKVSLMDWNSVVNAGMGGKVFQDALIRTSELLGTGAEAAIATYGSFRDSLTQGEWLTTDVLTETLKQFAGAYSEADLIQQGFTEQQAADIKAMADSADEAATKVKTFTQLWDVMKESAQSGWSQTWKLIIGDYEAAKALFTPIADFFTGDDGVITKISNARNELLESALGKSFTGLVDMITGVTGPLSDTAESIDSIVKSVQDYEKVVDEIIGGSWGNGEDRWNRLAEAGYDWAHAQNLVNEKLGDGTRHATDYSEAQGEIAEAQTTVSENNAKLIADLAEMSYEELKAIGYTDEQIAALDELAYTAHKTGIPLEEFIANIDEIDGRYLLIKAFGNAASGLVGIFKAIGLAWRATFEAMRADQLFDMIAGFHKFSLNLRLTDEETGKLNENGKKLLRTFKGVFAVIGMVADIVGGGLRIAFNIVTGILGYFDMNILDLTAVIGDFLVQVREFTNIGKWIGKALEFVIPLIYAGAESISIMFESFKNLPAVQNFVNEILKLKDLDFKEIGKNIIQGFKNGFGDGIKGILKSVFDLGKRILTTIKGVLGIHSPSTEFFDIGKNIILGLVNGIQNGFGLVWETIKNIGQKCIEFFNGIDWGNLFAVGVSLALVYFVKKIFDFVDMLSGPMEAITDLLENCASVVGNVSGAIKAFTGVMKSLSLNIKADALKKLAVAIAILVGSIVVLTLIDQKKMVNAVIIVGILAGVLVALAAAADKMSAASLSIGRNGAALSGLKTGLLSIAAAILLLGFTVKLVGELNTADAAQGFLGLSALVVVVCTVIKTLGKVSSVADAASVTALGSTLFKISIVMLILAGLVKLISGMEWGDMAKGAVGVLGLMGFITILMLITTIPAKNVEFLGGMLLKISIAMGILVIVAKMIAGMEWGDMAKAAVGMTGLIGFIALLLVVGMIPAKSVDKLGTTLLGLSAAMLLLAVTAKLIATMEWSEMGKATVGLIALSGVVGLLIGIVRLIGADAPKIGLTILALSVAIGILGGIAMMLSLIDLGGLAKGITAVGLLTVFMSGMLKATKGAEDCKGTIIALSVAIAVMAGSVALLSLIDTGKLLVATTALSILMTVFGLMVKMASNVQSSIGTLIVLTVAVGLLAVALGLIAQLPVESALASSASLSALLLSFGVVLNILNQQSSLSAKSVIALATLTAVVYALVGVLTLMRTLPVEGTLANATALSMLLLSMSVALAVLEKPCFTSGISLAAIGVLTVIVSALAVILWGMKDLPVESTLPNAEALSILLLAMSASCLVLSGVGALGPAALIGIGSLMALITGVGGLIMAIGALVTEFPKLQEFLNNGIPVIEKIGYAIGAFFGNVVGGFAAGALTGLPAIGESLSKFMDKASGFLEAAANTSEDVLKGVGIITASIIAITVADFIAAIGSIGGLGFSAIGASLVSFGDAVVPFLDKVGGIDPSVMTGVEALCSAILAITAANVLDGLSHFINGGRSIDEFATQILPLADALVSFVGKLDGFNESKVAIVKSAGDALVALSEAAQKIPNEGGLAAIFAGDNSISAFASQFPILAENLSGFVSALSGFDESKVVIVTNVGNALVALSEAAQKIPNEGGLAAIFAGDNSIAAFSSQFGTLATNLVGFVNTLSGFDESKVVIVKNVGDAILALATAANELPNGQADWAKFIFGDNSISAFSGQFGTLATNLSGFVNTLSGFDESKVVIVKNVGDAIVALSFASQQLPNAQTEWAKALFGDNSISAFSSQLPNFGSNMSKFASNLGEFSKGNVTAVECAANAIVALSKAKVDGQAGWAKVIFGDNGIGAFSSQLPGFGSNMNSFIKNLGSFNEGHIVTTEAAVGAITAFAKLANADLKGAKKQFSGFGEEAVDFAKDIGKFTKDLPSNSAIDTATKGIKKILDMIDDMSGKDASIITDFSNKLKKIGTDGVDKFVKAFTSDSAKKDVKDAGVKLIEKVIEGAESKEKSFKSEVEDIVEGGADAASSCESDFKSAGKDLGSGLVEGIEAKYTSVYNAAYKLGQKAVQGEKDGQKSKSPSKLTIQAGKWLGEGLIIGIEKMNNLVYKSGKGLGENASNPIADAISAISNSINEDINAEPTIRPVIDLSEVSSGVSAISGMFDMNPSVGVMSNIRSIGSMMGINQNGNDDVISALKDLKKTIGGLSQGSITTIGNITYDDGSNMTNAVESLIRAARIERRV